MDLREWALIFLKHQDLLKKEIKEIVEDGDTIVLRKRKDEVWQVQEQADFSADCFGVVILNTKENFEQLLSSWQSVKPWKIVFANPRTNERWVVVPDHHARVADEKSFKAGLEAMFGSIAEY